MSDTTAPTDLAAANADPSSVFTAPEVRSLDELLAGHLAETQIEVRGTETFAGREWRLVQPANMYALLSSADIAAHIEQFPQLVRSYIHPDERTDFDTVLRALPVVPVEFLLDLFNRFSERVADRPTGPSGS